MSIDPRIMRTMLQLQLSPTLDFNGRASASASNDNLSSLFDNLLTGLMAAESGNTGAGNAAALHGKTERTALAALVESAAVYGSLSPDASMNVNGIASSAGLSVPPAEHAAAERPPASGPNGTGLQSAAESGTNAGQGGNPLWDARLQAGSLAEPGFEPAAYDPLISEAASKYGVDASLIKAVISSESSFNAEAVSSSGAKGLMQLMDDTARSLGVSDAFDPSQNIEAGTRYLSYLIRKYDGSVPTALAAYNAGPGRLERLGIGSGSELAAGFLSLPLETQRYVTKVLQKQITYTV
ncbi:lytic transglycosylase domain-containing protein [Paenibacillus beijingensis]|uniref:Transglycosylase SLT domain-containing protein n=1 Tax=Paenibacillus beijingensis TaxID=1126833 RepID=A0A0D5NMW0_9BACL|nr:lytic transglycosylase domain-containing protein [Paenibacillus beijingensis]AJY76342.1 hypothetical protein VN24_19445 [Paenibacillus beijingensis]